MRRHHYFADTLRRLAQVIVEKVGVSVRGLRPGVAKQGSDGVQSDAGAGEDRCVGMAQVVNAQAGDLGGLADAAPIGFDFDTVTAILRPGKTYSESPRGRPARSWRAGALSGTMCSVRCLVVAPGLVQTPVSKSRSAGR
jgi:hypothetical protein